MTRTAPEPQHESHDRTHLGYGWLRYVGHCNGLQLWRLRTSENDYDGRDYRSLVSAPDEGLGVGQHAPSVPEAVAKAHPSPTDRPTTSAAPNEDAT